MAKTRLFIIPENANARIIYNRHGIIITAKADLIDKIRYFGEIDDDTKVEIKAEEQS